MLIGLESGDPFTKLAADLRQEAQHLMFVAFQSAAQIEAARAKEDAAVRIEALCAQRAQNGGGESRL